MAVRGALLLRDSDADQYVCERLQAAGHDLDVCGDWSKFERVAASTGLGLIVAPWLDSSGVLSELGLLRREHATYSLVLLTEDHPENLRYLARVRVDDVIFVSELGRLVDVIAQASVADGFDAAISMVRADGNLPVQLKRALLHLLEQEPARCPVEPEHPAAPARTIVALAKRRGCTPSHLSRLASRNGIRLGRVVDYCIALRALQLTSIERVSPDLAAWRMGFSGRDALSGHVARSLGVRLEKVRADQLPGWFERLVKMLSGSSGREITDSVMK